MSRVDTDELALLRSYPQRSKLYLGVQQGVSILTAQVDGDHTTGDTTILLKNVTCDDTNDLLRGMTVSIGALETRNRKVTAVYLSYNSGTLTLTIGPNAHTANNNDYVTVYSAFHLWKMDAPTFTAQKTPPFAIMGPPRAGFVGEPLSFVGEYSYSPVGRTISTYAWKKFDADLVSGSTTAANTQASPLVLSWDTAGEYTVRLTVTDSASEVGTSYRPVLMYDRAGANAPYQAFTVRNFRYNGAGWAGDFTVYGTATTEDFPPEALVVVWAEDWYNETKGGIGGAYRGASETVFAGWIRAGTVRANADDRSVSFTLDSIDAVANRLTMPSFTFRDGNNSTNWTTFDTLTIDKCAMHIIQQRTTLALMCDVFLALFAYEVTLLDVPEASLYAQLTQSIARAVFGYGAGSRFASFTLARDRNMLTSTLRPYLPTASIMITSADWMTLQVTEESFQGLARVRLEGRDGDDAPLAAWYPTEGPGHAGETRVISGLVFSTQGQADELAQRMYRRGNRSIKSVRLTLANYRVIEPAFQEYFTVILQTWENARGYAWDNELNGDTGREFLCDGMSIDFADGYFLVTLSGSASVWGAHGASWTLLETSPALQWVSGYGQVPAADDTHALRDHAGNLLTDHASYVLTEHIV